MPQAAISPIPAASPRPGEHLRFCLDLADDGPSIAARINEPDAPTFSYRTDIRHILVPREPGSVREIEALDVLEHACDEQTFLAECARLLGKDGQLRLRVPVDGVTGWLDALNIARYLAEMTGLVPEPMEPEKTGWHRHYRERDITRLVKDAGFHIETVRRVNPGFAELPHVAGIVMGQAVLKRPRTERTLFQLRQRIASIENAIPAGPLGTRLEIVARRA